ncbi:MAG: DUF3320 domain-containing protein [Alphaproteobacteria bacterium]|nr:DUF3320 domain-containing protein [Alphaproteobacteria bacterium]
MTDAVAAALETGRRALLDMSTRNRLLSLPRRNRSAGVIDIAGEKSATVFELLLREGKAFAFAPLPEPEGAKRAQPARRRAPARRKGAPAARPQPEAAPPPAPAPEAEAAAAVAAEGSPEDPPLLLPPDIDPNDLVLQTTLGAEALQRKLLAMHRDARLFMEEQGVDVLYLALGQLVWFEPMAPETERRAPLLLVPVALDRGNAQSAFKLKARAGEIDDNLSLLEKLRADFAIRLPALPAEDDAIDPAAYFAAVAEAIAGQPNWRVEADAIALGFFSFAKLMMYRDLDPASWPEAAPIERKPMVRAILVEGFPKAEPPLPDDTDLDDLIKVDRLDQVVESDSSQTLAAEEVRRGRSCVIQGPPGTGKSQTITNLIAQAVKDGRSVLFVAEKMAALEVVKRRLDGVGIGAACLELHSDKANKRAVLDDLRETLAAPRPPAMDAEAIINRLGTLRGRLNRHAAALHGDLGGSGLTPYGVIGELTRLRAAGIAPPDFALDTAKGWSAEDLRQRRTLVRDLADRVADIGTPARHPWRGVRAEGLVATDAERLFARLPALAQTLGALSAQAQGLAQSLGRPADAAGSLGAIAALVDLGKAVATAPAHDRAAIAHPSWRGALAPIADLVAAAERRAEARAKAGPHAAEAAWTAPGLAEARRDLAASAGSLMRFVSGSYRRAQAALRGLCSGDPPDATEDQLALLDAVIAGQAADAALSAGAATAGAAFGSLWHGNASDPAPLRALLSWVEAQETAGRRAAALDALSAGADAAAAGSAADALAAALAEARTALDAPLQSLALDTSEAFGAEGIGQAPLAALIERIGQWAAAPEALSKWSGWSQAARNAAAAGLAPLAERLGDGRLPPEDARPAFERAYHEAMLKEAMKAVPALAVFDGGAHARLVEDFKTVDKERMALARNQAASAHWQRAQAAAADPAIAVLRGEIARKRGHMPLRRLLRPDVAGKVVQTLKPVFMMSPLSVAQYLDPRAGTDGKAPGLVFDLLVMDEASQVEPMDAIGAMARARQIVVVGDDKQLPPTRFFQRMTSDDDAAEDEGTGPAKAADIESILGLCAARGLPQVMLRWHYRSKHESLIAVSNTEFYDSRLLIIPAPSERTPELGVQFQMVAGGVFDSGGTAVNRTEARAVAEAVMEHARRTPNRTLGVAAFSIKQRDAIEEEIEDLRRASPDTEPFFAAHPHEPFFVKNLENVQGDERDAIFISVGYARDQDGKLAMRFGPLSADGGERRLNVLISRAKHKCVVFSSLTADDIDLGRAGGRGVAAFKTYLQYARTGQIGADKAGAAAAVFGAAPPRPSAFEETVKDALEREGVKVKPQHGIAGLFIDLAIEHPDKQGRYLMGIECDGENYARARSARDRDRGREGALRMNGWTIHRIWSTDWFQRPEEQLRKALGAIEAAKAAATMAPPPAAKPAAPAATGSAPAAPEASPAPAIAPDVALAQPYRLAAFEVPKDTKPEDLPFGQMARIVVRIVAEEGPIHAEEVAARVAQLWGVPSLAPKAATAVGQALKLGTQLHGLAAESAFYTKEGAPAPVRDRSSASAPGLREAERLPPAEARAAILVLLGASSGASREEVASGTARLLGLGRPSTAVKAAIEVQIGQLIASGAVRESGGLLARAAS